MNYISTSNFEAASMSIIKFFMLAELLLSLFLTYKLFGIWWSVGFALSIVVVTFITVWVISSIHVKANPFKEQELWSQQNSKAILIFFSTTENIIFFPIRAVIVYYIYSQFEQGVLFILLYLLFLVGDSRARQHRNTIEANNVFNELRKNT